MAAGRTSASLVEVGSHMITSGTGGQQPISSLDVASQLGRLQKEFQQEEGGEEKEEEKKKKKKFTNVRFAVIGTENLGFAEFLATNFTAPENTFVDTSAVLHQRFSRPLSSSDVVKGVFSWSMWSRMSSGPKGNMVVGKDPYYMDSMLVVGGPEGRIYHSSTLNTLSDPFDYKALLSSVETSVNENENNNNS